MSDDSKNTRDANALGITCPTCRGPVVHRSPKPGGKRFQPFYGCAQFPRCRGVVTERDAGAIAHGDHPND